MEPIFTSEQIKDIAGHLLEELRELPDGKVITTAGLLLKQGYAPDDFGEEGLLSFHEALKGAAKAAGIAFARAGEYDENVSPYDARLRVINIRARIRCPYCGSRRTARILYGKPFFTKELQQKLDAGKVVLGGCCIETAEVDGKQVNIMPKRHCNKCGKDFGGPAYGAVTEQKMQEEASFDE